MIAQMPDQRSRVDFRQHWNLELFEIFFRDLLRAPVGADSRELANDQTFNIGPRGFVVFRIGAVISDFRIGENNNLAAVRRIGENFLVAGDGSIKNDLAVTFAFGAVAFAAEDAPVFQRKDSLHQCSREWILRILAQVQNRDGRTRADPTRTRSRARAPARHTTRYALPAVRPARSEEHTSELQSHHDLVCRLLLEKKKHKAPMPSTGTSSACRPADQLNTFIAPCPKLKHDGLLTTALNHAAPTTTIHSVA